MTTSLAVQAPAGGETSILLREQDRCFARELQALSRTNLNRCFHCRSCANGCPFIKAMDHMPNVIIRLAQFGLRREALQSRTIWVCVGCYTCAAECPNEIDIPAVMGALRHLALKEGVKVPEPNILDFHREVCSSVRRHGRTHELGIMLRYKARVHQWFTDLDLGFKLMARRKMPLLAHNVKARKEIGRLFVSGWQR